MLESLWCRQSWDYIPLYRMRSIRELREQLLQIGLLDSTDSVDANNDAPEFSNLLVLKSQKHIYFDLHHSEWICRVRYRDWEKYGTKHSQGRCDDTLSYMCARITPEEVLEQMNEQDRMIFLCHLDLLT